MITVSIPGRGDRFLAHLVLDLNGTLAFDGRLIDGVAERLWTLRDQLDVHVLTADTFGVVDEIESELGFAVRRIRNVGEKAAFVKRLGSASVVAIGNGANDAEMLSAAVLGIAVLGPEGLAREALEMADLVIPDILSALDLLLNVKRLVATLRM